MPPPAPAPEPATTAPPRGDRELWLLLGLGAVFRLAYALEYTRLPFLDTPLFDSVVYLRQAEAIGAGRFDDASLLAFSPLYGWLLAVFGEAVVFVQLLLGVVNAWLVARTAEALFGRPAGLAAAALFVGYGLFPFYETKVLSETLGTTLTLIALRLSVSDAFLEAKRAPGFACGLSIGAATLARANILLSLPFFVLAALAKGARPGTTGAQRLLRSAYLAAGVALILGANGLFNLANSGHFVPVIMVSGTARAASQSSWSGDLRDASAEDSPMVSAWDVVRQAERSLAGDEPPAPAGDFDLGAFLQAAPGKLTGAFRDIETSFQYGYYGERSELRSLRILPVTFGVLGVLCLWGLLCLYREERLEGLRRLVPLLPFVLGTMATSVIFHPSTRYRIPLALVMVILAGFGAERLWSAARGRQQLLAVAVVGAVAVAFSVRTVTYELRNPALWELRIAEGEAFRGNIGAADERIERARALAPDDPSVEQRIRYIRGPSGEPAPPPDGQPSETPDGPR